MILENCPRCSNALSEPLASGRQACACGWVSPQQRNKETLDKASANESVINDNELSAVEPNPVPKSQPSIIINTESGIVQLELSTTCGYAGALLLFLGSFAPLVRFPVVGSISAVRDGSGDGLIFIALSIASGILMFRKAYSWLWLTGFGAGAILLIEFLAIQWKINQIKSEMDSRLEGNPFRGLADAFVQSIQIEWGWAILFLAVGLILATPYLKQATLKRQALIGLGIITLVGLGSTIFSPSLRRDFSPTGQQSRLTEARERGAEITLGAINRAQQAFYLENNNFTNSFDELRIGPPSANGYDVQVTHSDSKLAISKALAQGYDLRSIAGAVRADNSGILQTIICKAEEPSQQIDDPFVVGDDLACGSGSSRTQ
jgi:hypothetical protein